MLKLFLFYFFFTFSNYSSTFFFRQNYFKTICWIWPTFQKGYTPLPLLFLLWWLPAARALTQSQAFNLFIAYSDSVPAPRNRELLPSQGCLMAMNNTELMQNNNWHPVSSVVIFPASWYSSGAAGAEHASAGAMLPGDSISDRGWGCSGTGSAACINRVKPEESSPQLFGSNRSAAAV